MGGNGAAPVVWWLGPAVLGEQVAAAFRSVGGRWESVIDPARAPSTRSPTAVIDASAMDPELDVRAAGALVDGLLRGSEPPRRVVHIVSHAWLGRGHSAAASARNASVVAHARANALAVAPTGTTVNVIAVPDGFPTSAPAGAPLRVDIGVDDLLHALRYFLDADNSYVIGQVISVCGGDDAWGNHSL